jgi:hypothetical protein
VNPASALGRNPRPTPKTIQDHASAPEAADWLKHPAALVKRVTLAMKLAQEPEYTGPEPPVDHSPVAPVVISEEGAILLE